MKNLAHPADNLDSAGMPPLTRLTDPIATNRLPAACSKEAGPMDISRRGLLKALSAGCVLGLPQSDAIAGFRQHPGWVRGHMTGAEALVETLIQEGTACVFGIPGAQQNELWDTMKARHLGYLLVTHEASAAMMADGCARSTGRPGVLCVVPGPGLTNSLTGIGEALLDSVPMV